MITAIDVATTENGLGKTKSKALGYLPTSSTYSLPAPLLASTSGKDPNSSADAPQEQSLRLLEDADHLLDRVADVERLRGAHELRRLLRAVLHLGDLYAESG